MKENPRRCTFKLVNLKDKTLMPGLVEGRLHPLGGGDMLDDCDLGNVEATIAGLVSAIAECDAADPATDTSDWLLFSNWSPVGVQPNGTKVTRQDLDASFPNRPGAKSASLPATASSPSTGELGH